MKDRSKKLTVINTERKPSVESGKPTNQTGYSGYGGSVSVNLSDYLLKRIWDKIFEIRTTEEGEEYIFCKTNFVSQFGVTMYADEGLLDLPSIYEGLPIDMDTLYWVLDENGKKLYLKAKGGEGNGSFGDIETLGEGNAITKVDVVKGSEGEADKLVFTKEKVFIEKEQLEKDYLTKVFIEENYLTKANIEEGYLTKKHIEENYYTKTNTDEIFFKKDDAEGLFVTLDETTQEILGVKTFKNGLNIGSSKIWQSQDDVVYVDANLVVRGGVTMYGLNQIDVPTIMAGVAVDEVTISKKNGYLEVIGGGGGSIEYPLSWSGFSSGSYDGTSSKTIYIPSKVSELTNDSKFLTQSALNNSLADYLPLTGGTLTGELVATTISGGGENLYLGNEDNSAYVYLNEDMRSVGDNWSISLAGAASFASLTVNGNTAIHAGNYTSYFNPNNYITSIANVQATEAGATFNRYLGITKGGSTTNLTVGYAVNSRLIKAYSVSDLSTNSAWNTTAGMCCNYFASNASNIPATPGNNANGVISFMTTWNYGFQIGYLNSLSTGYETIPHVFFRNFVNGSYKAWYRIVTNGPQMTFDGINWSNPYMRMRYQSGSWYYVQMRSDGMWLGLSNTNGVRIDASGNLLATGGVTMYGTSDKRLKKNIRTFSASEELMKLGGVYQFEYVEEEIKRNEKYKGTHFGLIYQNVKESSLSKMCMEREDGFGALNYLDTSFISLLAAVGMEHETRLQKLERENKELKAKVEQLERK